MHLRARRLQCDVQADTAALELRCPPTTLLTLVENAIRHGIDPSEEGGRIDVRVELWDGRCRVRVTDTGLGLHRTDGGLGTGLDALPERLELVFGQRDVQLRIARSTRTACAPSGISRGGVRPTTHKAPTALIADDEPLLRTSLGAPACRCMARPRDRRPGAQRP